MRPASPLKNGSNGLQINLIERDTVVFPRIVTLIRNGIKPRKVRDWYACLSRSLNSEYSSSVIHIMKIRYYFNRILRISYYNNLFCQCLSDHYIASGLVQFIRKLSTFQEKLKTTCNGHFIILTIFKYNIILYLMYDKRSNM
jgi:hypothetical protein